MCGNTTYRVQLIVNQDNLRKTRVLIRISVSLNVLAYI